MPGDTETLRFRAGEIDLPVVDGRRDVSSAAVRAAVAGSRERLQAWHLAGASGEDIVVTWTGVIDRIIRFLHEGAVQEFALRNVNASAARCSVLAQGGYGRGELNPHSDIDLLFLHPWKVSPFVEYVTEKILYTLWDTGLQVGQAVRSVAECMRLGERDFKVKTSLLDVRFLCGDEALAAELETTIDKDILKQSPEPFFQAKVAESEERHRRYGESVYLLEPNLKEGEGGLRDFQTAFWLARVKFKIKSFREIVHKSVVGEGDFEAAVRARDFLWCVRNTLHFLAGGHQDQLTFEYQDRVAEILGYTGDEERRAVERFMQDYYRHADVIARFAESVITRCLARPSPYQRMVEIFGRRIRPGLRIARGEILVEEADLFEKDPAAIVNLFLESQRHGAPLGARARDLVRREAHRLEPLRADAAVAQSFREILRGKSRIYETLAEMHALGVLDALIPEFGALRGMVIRDFHHIYTVDEHTLRGIRALEQLASGEHKALVPLLTQVMHSIDDREGLFLAMLLHDVGKGHGHGHSDRGARYAMDVAVRLGFHDDDAREISRLVRHHLLMSHVAQHLDLEDERVVIDFARHALAARTVDKLYVMTFADMRSVAPKVWNGWRDMLLAELYLRTVDVFARGTFEEEDPEARAERAKEKIRREIAARRPPVETVGVEEAFERFPASYFLSADPDGLLAHVDLIRAHRESGGGATTSLRHLREREFSELVVATADRPGLSSMITGVLTAAGRRILSARITTRSDGIVLDVFRVVLDPEESVENETARWERIRRALDEVLRGVVTIESVVEQMPKRSILTRKPMPRVETSVTFDNESSQQYTLLEVSAEDSIGVLYAITRTLYDLGCTIHRARISTVLQHVYDVFYVTDLGGRKVWAEHWQQELRQRIAERLEENRAQLG